MYSNEFFIKAVDGVELRMKMLGSYINYTHGFIVDGSVIKPIKAPKLF